MFTLKLYDRKGKELKEGDILMVSDGKRHQFYARVTWLAKEKVLAPFHTFCFHSFEKVDSVPAEAEKSKEEIYDIWYLPDHKEDPDGKSFEHYLMSWRECEHHLGTRCWRIEKIN